MRDPFPLKKFPGRILLRCRGSGMPGMSWDAVVAFVPTKTGVEVWHSSDLDEAEPTSVDVLSGPVSPRSLVQFLAEHDEVCCGGDFLGSAEASGVKGLWKDLLLLAWMHDEDGALHLAAGDFLSLDDKQLIELWKDMRGFSTSEAEEIRKLLLAAEEDAGMSEPTLASLARLAAEGPLTLKSLKDALRKEKAREKRRLSKMAADRAKRLEPFRRDIEEALAAWRTANPGPSGSNAYMGWRIRQGGVTRFLENYVVEHGAMPAGLHDLGKGPMNVVVGVHNFSVPPKKADD